jgi:3-oxoacyl-[acyl-carrier-protein] synthase II
MDVPTSAGRLLADASGIREVPGLQAGSRSFAGVIEGFDPSRHFSAAELATLDRTAQLAIVAAEEAGRDAAVLSGGRAVEPERTALVLGTSHGGRSQLDRFVEDGSDPNKDGAAARMLLHAAHYHQTDAVAARLGLKGPVATVSSACSSSAGAVAHACDLIASGRASVVVAGGADAYSKLTAAGFTALNAIAEGPCGPFSSRVGLSLGEAAAFVVLERLEDARARGARIHAEIFGCGLSWDAYHITEPEPSGAGLLRAARSALAAGGITPDEIDYVHAHGTGTRANDGSESLAIRRLFPGRETPPTSSTKSFTGHTLGAAGTLGLILSIVAMQRNRVAATLHFDAPRPGCDLDYVPNRGRPASVRRFIVDACGFGGANAVLVGGTVGPERRPGHGREGRIAITGIGLVSSLGCGVEPFVAGLEQGRSGVAPIRRFDTGGARARSAALVADFDPRRLIPSLDLRRMDLVMQFAAVAAHQALGDARIGACGLAAERIGLVVATSRGAVGSFERYLKSVQGAAWHKATPIHFPNLVMSSIGGQVSRAFGFKGACSTIVDGVGCGLGALIHAAELLRQSEGQDALVVLATDEVAELFFRLSDRLGRLAPEGAAMRPYHPSASGLSLGEGAVALVLERTTDANARGASIRAELTGAGLSHDVAGYLVADPTGAELVRAMRLALAEAGTDAAGVDVIYGHGRGVPACDAREARALSLLLEGRRTPVGCVLANTGVAEASSGLFSVAAAVLGLERDLAWPIAGDGPPDGELAFVSGAPRPGRYCQALVAGSTDSGNNAALVLRRGAEIPRV